MKKNSNSMILMPVLAFVFILLSGCGDSLEDKQEVVNTKPLDASNFQFIVHSKTKKNIEEALEDTFNQTILNKNLQNLLQEILPNWKVIIDDKALKEKIVSVIGQNKTRKNIVKEVLKRLDANYAFYDKLTPKTLVVLSKNKKYKVEK